MIPEDSAKAPEPGPPMQVTSGAVPSGWCQTCPAQEYPTASCIHWDAMMAEFPQGSPHANPSRGGTPGQISVAGSGCLYAVIGVQQCQRFVRSCRRPIPQGGDPWPNFRCTIFPLGGEPLDQFGPWGAIPCSKALSAGLHPEGGVPMTPQGGGIGLDPWGCSYPPSPPAPPPYFPRPLPPQIHHRGYQGRGGISSNPLRPL